MSAFRTIKVEDAKMQRIQAKEGLWVLEPHCRGYHLKAAGPVPAALDAVQRERGGPLIRHADALGGWCARVIGHRAAPAHLIDHVFPDVPARQRVLSLPRLLR